MDRMKRIDRIKIAGRRMQQPEKRGQTSKMKRKSLSIAFRIETYIALHLLIFLTYALNFAPKEERESLILSGGIYIATSMLVLLILRGDLEHFIPGWGVITVGLFMHFLSTIFEVPENLKNLEINIIAIGTILMFYSFIKMREEMLRREEMLANEKRITENLNNILRIINRVLRHDISNHLISAIALVELAKEGGEEQMRYIEEARSSLEKGIHTIRRMRELEMLTMRGEFKHLNLRRVVEEAAKSYAITIRMRGDCTVLADDALFSVFDNLFMNACKHGKAKRIYVTVEERDDSCEVRVADDGVGIPDGMKDKVFDEGFTTGGGSGLGLYIVKKTIERYNGKIWIEDNRPSGAVFVISLPKAGKMK